VTRDVVQDARAGTAAAELGRLTSFLGYGRPIYCVGSPANQTRLCLDAAVNSVEIASCN
jgi:hypothetical protein